MFCVGLHEFGGIVDSADVRGIAGSLAECVLNG